MHKSKIEERKSEAVCESDILSFVLHVSQFWLHQYNAQQKRIHLLGFCFISNKMEMKESNLGSGKRIAPIQENRPERNCNS